MIGIDHCARRLDVNEIANVLYVGGDFNGDCGLTAIDVDPTRPTFHTVIGAIAPRGWSSGFAINRKTSEVYRVPTDLGGDPRFAHLHVIDDNVASPAFHGVKMQKAFDISGSGTDCCENHLDFNGIGGVAINPNTGPVYIHFSDVTPVPNATRFSGSILSSST